MTVSLLGSRSTRLFVFLTAFFVGNAVVAEFVGVKIFALETRSACRRSAGTCSARRARSASRPAC